MHIHTQVKERLNNAQGAPAFVQEGQIDNGEIERCAWIDDHALMQRAPHAVDLAVRGVALHERRCDRRLMERCYLIEQWCGEQCSDPVKAVCAARGDGAGARGAGRSRSYSIETSNFALRPIRTPPCAPAQGFQDVFQQAVLSDIERDAAALLYCGARQKSAFGA
jgi:hypothetical protein